MATTTTKPDLDIAPSGAGLSAWPKDASGSLVIGQSSVQRPSQRDALQALLAFSALHDQIRRRRALASRHGVFDSTGPVSEFEPAELFVLDEVLQLVAERAVAITGADGLAIALAESNEIVLRASAGSICPDPGTRIDRDSAFSGACFRSAQIVICDDTETDPRVNLHACRKLGARSMVAVPLCGRRRVIGVLEAFSSWPFAFNEIDVRNLTLLAELVLGALKPEDEDRFTQSAEAAATRLETPKAEPAKAEVKPAPLAVPASAVPVKPARPATPPVKAAAPAPTAPVQSPASTVPAVPVAPNAPYAASIKTTVAQPQAPKPVAPQVAAVPIATPVPPKPIETPPTSATTSLAAKVESTPEPGLTFGQLDKEKSQRPWMVFMLVGVVIAAAFSVGVWWKLKSAQIGGQMVQNQPTAESAQSGTDQTSDEA